MSDDEDLSRPVLPGPGATDYERYLRTDELLALQKPAAERAHHDELLFQTVHQTSELWLKLATAEVEQATQALGADETSGAARMLARATLALQFVTDQLDMLDRMSPWDYHHVRVMLGHGAGFDSPGFRRTHEVTPRLWSAYDQLLERRGATLIEVYQQAARHSDLLTLAELLTDWDERLWVWRFRHYVAVARALGEETIGTQGTPVQVLGKLIAQRQLPRLWEARSRLTELFNAEQAQAARSAHGAPGGCSAERAPAARSAERAPTGAPAHGHGHGQGAT